MSPLLLSLIGGGMLRALAVTSPLLLSLIGSGMLRALAVTTAIRSDVLPDIPTLDEFVPG
jgi:tripartite-type tricarboxylate transporter receptor subunit TctC